MSKPKTLIWDIETSLMDVRTFGIWNQNIPTSRIKEDWHILCGAWKWQGEKKVHAIAQEELRNDLEVTSVLRDAVSEADIIVHHNGAKFDIRKLNTRIIKHGLDPLPPSCFSAKSTVDTLKAARKYFGFTSNRLDYIGHFLGVGGKLHTEAGLWDKVCDGDKKALAKMVRYNKRDVTLLEDVYDILRPHIHNHPNLNIYREDEAVSGCPKCGSSDIQHRGYNVTASGKYRRFQCQSCGAWGQSGKSVKSVDIR